MRILLLRVLLGWWAIPCMWFLIFPLGYLMSGSTKESTNVCKYMTNILWDGNFD